MNQDLGLRILGQIMNWSDERALQEFSWLKLMARLKYDGYRDFQAGMRFIESLANWLQQFDQSERETAYAFVRNSLVYIGPSEIRRLVEQFYPSFVRTRHAQIMSSEYQVPLHHVLIDERCRVSSERLCRQTLFMGLSDGARIDTIRHANSGILGNEQFVQGTQVDPEKWKDLLNSLREELQESDARFRVIYLVDDFAGSGTSFLRYDEKLKKWKGKLIRFRESVINANLALGKDHLFEDNWVLCVHHYLASEDAAKAIPERLNQIGGTNGFFDDWASQVFTTFGMTFSHDLPISLETHADFVTLTNTYYDPILRTKHTDVGGKSHIGLGYGGCALPVVLEHNTPNNSVALLWAETEGGLRGGIQAPAMRPLFRRRQRHG